MLLLDFSQEYLQNIKILPFIASILVVVFTALITIQISKKKVCRNYFNLSSSTKFLRFYLLILLQYMKIFGYYFIWYLYTQFKKNGRYLQLVFF